MKTLGAHRRHPAAIFALLVLALTLMGSLYSTLEPTGATADTSAEKDIAAGKQLFTSNCASCHGANGQGNGDAGPSLVGVGAAAVDFQVGTGRMPAAGPNVQIQRGPVQFSQEQIRQMAAYVASLGPGPAVPPADMTDKTAGNAARGGELFRVNCAMCHNSSGRGGALTRGKYAPPLMGVEEKHIYEAMLTGPQSMPVFNDNNLKPEDKRDVIAFLKHVEEAPSEGGNDLGALGPVGDGLFIWTLGIGTLIAAAVWLGRKAA